MRGKYIHPFSEQLRREGTEFYILHLLSYIPVRVNSSKAGLNFGIVIHLNDSLTSSNAVTQNFEMASNPAISKFEMV